MDKLEALSSVMKQKKPSEDIEPLADINGVKTLIFRIMYYALCAAKSQVRSDVRFFTRSMQICLNKLHVEMLTLDIIDDHSMLDREMNKLYSKAKTRYKGEAVMRPNEPKLPRFPKRCPWALYDFIIHQDRGEKVTVVADKIINKLRKEK